MVSVFHAPGSWVQISDIRFIYDGWNLVSETISNRQSTITNSYCWGLDLSGSLQGAGGIGRFERLIGRLEGLPVQRCRLGNQLDAAGHFPEAIKQYEQVLRITPGFIEARDALARLQTGGK